MEIKIKRIGYVTIYKKENIYYIYYSLNGKRFRYPVGRNLKNAELSASNLNNKIDRIKAGLELPKEIIDISIQKFYDEIIQHIKTRKTPRTFETYNLHFNNFYNFLKNTKTKNIAEIDISVVNNFIVSRIDNGTHNNTINHELDSLRTIFNIAIDLNLIDQNPFIKLKSVRPPKIKKPPFYFYYNDLEKIFNKITPRFLPYFRTLLFTGVRSGELELFEWDDFDLNNRIVKVRTKKISERKMRSRNIPMHHKVMESYLERKRLNESDKYVFTTKNGKPIGVQMLRKQFKKFMKMASLTKGSVHTLRHTFASNFISRTGDIYYLSKLLGHTHITQTEIYAHLLPIKDFKIIESSLNFDI